MAIMGLVMSVQRFSLHDGPGVRTTAFLMGCNLRCRWCHNPESFLMKRRMMFYQNRCVGCGRCVTLCNRSAHVFAEDGHHMDPSRCIGCNRLEACAQICPAEAMVMCGKEYTPEELDKIEKSINNPIKKAIQKKYYTPEKKAILDTLRAQKKVPEFRAIAEKIKSDINFEWENNTDKLYMDDEKRKAYTTIGGVHHLDKEYTVFGELIEGFDVLDKIAALPTDRQDRPFKDVRIISVKIIK